MKTLFALVFLFTSSVALGSSCPSVNYEVSQIDISLGDGKRLSYTAQLAIHEADVDNMDASLEDILESVSNILQALDSMQVSEVYGSEEGKLEFKEMLRGFIEWNGVSIETYDIELQEFLIEEFRVE